MFGIVSVMGVAPAAGTAPTVFGQPADCRRSSKPGRSAVELPAQQQARTTKEIA